MFIKFSYISDFSRPLKAFLSTKFLAYTQASFAQFLINVFFWKISHDIRLLVLFNVTFAVTHAITYLPVAKISKEYDHLLPLRFATVVQLFYLGLIIYLGENIVSFIVPVAILGGMASGSYWLSDNLLKFDLTHPDNRFKFTSAYQVIKNITGSIVPMVASFLVISNGDVFHAYNRVFITATFFAFLVLLSTFFIFDGNDYKKSPFRFRAVSSRLWRDKNIRIVCANTLLGEVAGVLPKLLILLLFIKSGTELSLGGYQTLAVMMVVISNYFAGKYFSRKDYRNLLTYWGLANFACVLILLFSQSSLAILTYGLLKSLLSFTTNPSSAIGQDAMTHHCNDKEEQREMRIEYLVLKEWFDATGKIIGFTALLLVGNFLNPSLVTLVILLCALAELASNIWITRVKFSKNLQPILQ